MRSRAERLARALGVAALATALAASVWQAWRVDAPSGVSSMPPIRLDATTIDADSLVARAVRERIVRAAVQQARTSAASDAALVPTVRLAVSAIPRTPVRRVLGAARAAGVSMQWEDSTTLRALSFQAVRTVSPDSAVDLTASAEFVPSSREQNTRSGRALVMTDGGGVLDSIAVVAQASGGDALNVRLRVSSLSASAGVRVSHGGRVIAGTLVAPAPTPTVGRVRLYAQPGWEAKFVTAALEESGWQVDASFLISPKAAMVRVGNPMALDTSRYAVAVVLDSGVVASRELLRFVSQGGGVIVAGAALRDAAVRTLSAAAIEDDRGAIAGTLITDEPRRGVPAFHLAAREGATVVEREGDEPTVVLVRRDVGRVMAVGYRDTWHWRMEGRDDAADAFRLWWNGLVSSVAYVGAQATVFDAPRETAVSASMWPGRAAPVADMVAQLGAAAPLDVAATSSTRMAFAARLMRVLPWVLAVLIVGSLLVEWAMRRLRGAS
ncbi:MAG: hypothetical protein IT353_23255 [Gemmatimonadaceae bacterium]|nr:hypothetical protein [Gemmatimonadaceae bacterium]